jgi:hypothetical protein
MMKLFVWNDPYDVSYGNSFAFAVADTEERARAEILARNDSVYSYGRFKQTRPNFTVLDGAPLRVVDLEPGAAYAEILEWSE